MAKSIFQKIWDWLAGMGAYVMNLIVEAFSTTAKNFLKKFGPQLMEIIKEVQADPTLVDGKEKQMVVFNRIKEIAIKAGYDAIKDSIINMAIEIVYQALQNTGELGPNVGAVEKKSKIK